MQVLGMAPIDAVGWCQVHDPSTIAYLLRPDLFDSKMLCVDVETAGVFTAGQAVSRFRWLALVFDLAVGVSVWTGDVLAG